MNKFILGLFVFGLLVVPQSGVNAYYVTGGGETISVSSGSNNGYGNESSYVFSVSTYSADNIGDNLATLKGYVNYNGGYGVSCWFEWGTNSSSLNNISNRVNYGSGSSPCSYTISGLSSNTTYYYRAVAQNQQSMSYGPIMSFRTNTAYYPTINSSRVVTNLATSVAYTGAELNGFASINSGAGTNSWFEWGTTTSLGNVTNKIYIGSGNSVNFKETLSNLSPNTVYYYRAVAENNYGVVRGDILSFKTVLFSLSPNTGTEDSGTSKVKSVVKSSNDKNTINESDKKDNGAENDEVSANSKDDKTSGMAAIIFGADGFLPNSLLEWMLLFASILVMIACFKCIFGVGKNEKEVNKNEIKK